MSKCRGCRELFRSVLRSVQAIKLLKDSVCKKLFTHKFDSRTHQFEQDGLDSSGAPQSGVGLSQSNTVEDFVFDDFALSDFEYFPTACRESTGQAYPTNLESTSYLDHQAELSWLYPTGELHYDSTDGEPSHFTERPSPQPILHGDAPVQLLFEQRAVMYGYETGSAWSPSPQPNYEAIALSPLWCISGSPGSTFQSPFDLMDQFPPLQYQQLPISGASYERLVECEKVTEGDDHFQTPAELQYNSWHTIPQVPSTPARRLGWCAIRNMVRAWTIFLSRMVLKRKSKRKSKEDDDSNGAQHKKSRHHKFRCECRLSRSVHGIGAGKVWLGTFSAPEEADRVYDVGRMFCSKRAKGFNFPVSEGILSILKGVILNLPLPQRKLAIKDIAEEYGITGRINKCTWKYCSNQR